MLRILPAPRTRSVAAACRRRERSSAASPRHTISAPGARGAFGHGPGASRTGEAPLPRACFDPTSRQESRRSAAAWWPARPGGRPRRALRVGEWLSMCCHAIQFRVSSLTRSALVHQPRATIHALKQGTQALPAGFAPLHSLHEQVRCKPRRERRCFRRCAPMPLRLLRSAGRLATRAPWLRGPFDSLKGSLHG